MRDRERARLYRRGASKVQVYDEIQEPKRNNPDYDEGMESKESKKCALQIET